jgi:hypothetical protein
MNRISEPEDTRPGQKLDQSIKISTTKYFESLIQLDQNSSVRKGGLEPVEAVQEVDMPTVLVKVLIGYQYESVRGWPDLHGSRSKKQG